MRYLRTNTATRVAVGPFIDKTDGITPEVALTVTSEKLTLVVDTGGVPTLVLDVAPTASGGANDMVHITGDDSGFYDLELAAADVNYLGRAILSLNDVATHCPVFHEFMIVPAVVYDSMFLGTDLLDISVVQVAGSTTNVSALATNVDAILTDTGTTLETHLTDMKGATFAGATDSLEAIRDRGDAAWVTGAGGSDRLLMVDTTIATLATQVSFTLTAGSADNDAYNNCTIIIEDVSTATQKAVGMVLDYVGATKTVTLKEALAFTIAATDKVYILAENSLKSTVANRQLDVTATGAAGIDWGNIENPTTAVDLSATDIQLCDTTTTNTDMRGTNSAALASVCTEGRLAELDAANLPATTDAILVDTAVIGALGAGLTAVPWNAAWDAEVQSECADALNAYDSPTNTEMVAAFTEIKGATFDSTNSLEAISDRSSGVRKNTALSNFEFFMRDSTDHVTGKIGLTITATRSIDGAAFGSCANSAVEVASGLYKIDLAAADLNGTVITLKFTGTDADATLVTIKTEA